MARPGAVTLADIERPVTTSQRSRVLYVLRRWPVPPTFIVSMLIAGAVFAPFVSPNEPERQDLRARTSAPFWYPDCQEGENGFTSSCVVVKSKNPYTAGAHPLGLGLLWGTIYGARASLTSADVSIIVGTVVGATLGLTAGYFGGTVDELTMRITDAATAIPYLLPALIAVAVFGQRFTVILGLQAPASRPDIVRLVRGQTLQIKTPDCVALAKVAGASTPRIMVNHMLPGVANTIVATALQAGPNIPAEPILGFLWACVPPPTPPWGSMSSDGRDYLRSARWVAFFPGIATVLTVPAFNSIGDWRRDLWDPRLRWIS